MPPSHAVLPVTLDERARRAPFGLGCTEEMVALLQVADLPVRPNLMVAAPPRSAAKILRESTAGRRQLSSRARARIGLTNTTPARVSTRVGRDPAAPARRGPAPRGAVRRVRQPWYGQRT
jgi:hypothetical protein